MSKQELKDYLGTIAKSGTAETLAKIQESKDASNSLLSNSVGFYSVSRRQSLLLSPVK